MSHYIIYKDEYYIVCQSKDVPMLPGYYNIFEKTTNWDYSEQMIRRLAHLQKSIRDFFCSINIELVGIYIEQDEENSMIVSIIPFHIDRLKELNISPDLYQPYINKYLESFRYKNSLQAIDELNKKVSQFLYRNIL